MAENSPSRKSPDRTGPIPVASPAGGALDRTLPLPPGVKPGFPLEPGPRPPMQLGLYELIEKLGQGGMGAVWKARHTKLDKLVAVKLLPPHLTLDADAVSRLEREMKAVGKLEHPHIVRAMDAGCTDGVHYLVMEYIEGTDLSRLVKSRGPRSVPEACQMVRHAALGLAHAHEHGLVHRDIKPSNLLLSKRGQVKILDLGLARLQSERTNDDASLTMQGAAMGTPDYMAPEQWHSAHTAGPAADLYGLGCTLYHLLTGQPPFGDQNHSTYADKMKAHLGEPPRPLRQLRSDTPAEVEALCQRLLAKNAQDRPTSAKDLAQELHELLKSWTKAREPVETIPWPAPPPALSTATTTFSDVLWRYRQAILGTACALLVVTLILVAAAANRRRFDARPPPPEPSVSNSAAATLAASSPRLPEPALAIAPFNAAQARARQEAWAYYLGVPFEYTNSLGMKFCLIPPGEYERGSPAERIDEIVRKAENAKRSDLADRASSIRSEAPRHSVRIARPFFLAAHEVTQDQFTQLMGFNPSFFSNTGDGRDMVDNRDRDRLPVESITFEQAVEFCRKLSHRESPAVSAGTDPAIAGYRLPTDAEWEFACRAGTITWFCCGGAESEIGKYAWFRRGSTGPVGSLKSNAFGLFDMHGNVWEICQDFFAEDDYATLGPGTAVSPTGPATGTFHVIRGGAFGSAQVLCRSASRRAFDEPRAIVGFRPALSIEAVRLGLAAHKSP